MAVVSAFSMPRNNFGEHVRPVLHPPWSATRVFKTRMRSVWSEESSWGLRLLLRRRFGGTLSQHASAILIRRSQTGQTHATPAVTFRNISCQTLETCNSDAGTEYRFASSGRISGSLIPVLRAATHEARGTSVPGRRRELTQPRPSQQI